LHTVTQLPGGLAQQFETGAQMRCTPSAGTDCATPL
jgi:hypothetical protein